MKIMFLRESEGIYQFGRKKVQVKLEKGGQVLIRVGGGYVTIAEFIETYTPLEINKIDRQDDSKRLNLPRVKASRGSRDLSFISERKPVDNSVHKASHITQEDSQNQ